MIQLQNVTKRYGIKTAVDNLSLEIPDGELFAFLGPNGAGKTTTIKMMVGLLRPTRGSVHLGGVDVVKDPREANRMVGYVPDQPYLYDKLTGREFLRFTAEMYGLNRGDADRSIDDQIDAFGLGDFVDELTESYSHGMKQRVVFASALVHRPKILVVDEPMVGLDPKNMRFVKDLLRREARRGATVFMSTHTLPVAEEIADRIGIFDQGTVQFLGSVTELRQQSSLADSSLESLFLELTDSNPHSPEAGAA